MRLLINPRQIVLDRMPAGAVAAEIGVNYGSFSAEILRIVKPKKLYLIDPWIHSNKPEHANSHYGGKRQSQASMDARHKQVCNKLSKQIDAGVVEIIRAESAKAVEQIGDGELDFVYIDGDHAYDAVKLDIELYRPKVKAGGFIIGDDYEAGKWWGDGVLRAFNEFIGANPVQVEMKIGTQIIVRV